VWSDGSDTDFEYWNGGEPNDHGSGEDCTHFTPWTNGGWNDIPCNNQYPYICRIP
jgi:hypothetical protein